jgi:hypothetical protein
MANEFYINWVDEDGVETRQTMNVDESDPAAVEIQNLIAALGAVSEAAVTRYGIILSAVPDPEHPATGGPYDIADKLILESTTSAGGIAKLAFPCPKGSDLIFDDSDNCDIEDPLIVALYDAMKAIWEHDSQTLVELVRGYRHRSSRENN